MCHLVKTIFQSSKVFHLPQRMFNKLLSLRKKLVDILILLTFAYTSKYRLNEYYFQKKPQENQYSSLSRNNSMQDTKP